MNKFFLVSLIVLIPYILRAQQPEESQVKLRQVTPPSPQASALGKYGDIPVGNFTGTADISIPIYSLKIKDFTLPVAISYHTGGIKVEETATNVGLGWALSYGGNISVSVNGLNDFESNGFCNVISDPLKRLPDQPFPSNNVYNWYADGGGDLYKFAVDAAEGTTDTEPDLHYYSIPGNSGKFYFDQYDQAHTIPMSALKIQHFDGKYQITDEKGIIYSFEDVDQSVYDNTCNVGTVTGNFLLTKILLPDNNWITFTYVNNQYSLLTAKPETRTKLAAGQYGPTILECSNMANTITIRERVITKIESSTGTTVQFNYGTDRLDLPGTKNLASIAVLYQGQTKETYEFRQSYFSGTESRLKLDKVICNTNQTYEFEYETSVSLPSRLSFSQDHWGYYNNKSNNTLLPLDTEYGFTTGADRSPDFNYAKMAILKKVIYPTKGYTILEYEPNDYVYSGVKNVDVEKYNNLYSVADQTVTKQFTLPAPAQVLSVRAFYNAVAMNPGDEIPMDAPCSISLSGPNGYFSSFQGVSLSQGELLTGLAAGTYTMDLTTTGSYPSGYFSITVVERTSTNVTENREIGGLRVKRKTDYDAITSNNKVTRYLYKDEKTGLSTGKINFQPQYTYLYTHANMKDVISFTNYWKQATSSIFPLGSIKGGSVAYTTVTVLNGENGENGKIVYNYSFFPPYNIQNSFPLVPTSNEDWHNGLLLNEKSYKYNSPNDFSLIGQTINYYSDKKEEDFWNAHYSAQSLKANEYLRGWAIRIIYKNPPGTSGLSFTPATFSFNDYHLESKWLRLDSTVTRQYYGTDSVSTSQLFEYGNPAHFLKTKQTVLASNKIKYSTEFKYPQDSFTGLSATAETARQQLVAKNNITALMESSRYVGATKLEQIRTSYKVFSSNLCLPETIEAQSGSAELEKRVQFNNYNTYGNLLNQSLTDGAKIGYQWSAANQSLLAECKNAAENEFYFESFEEDAAASIVKFHTGKKCNYNRNFTVSFTKPNTRSYLISWFEFDGSKWVYKEETYTGSKAFTTTQYVDDIRVYPFDAQMTSYTYDPLVGMTSATDVKGQTAFYEYDEFGRLKYIKDADGFILKDHTYNYKQ
ncbi:hypothetical protein D3C80_272140 [compost metagenome]